MATRKQVMARLKELNGTMDEEYTRINLDPPHGKVWASNLIHTLAYDRRGWRMSDLYSDMLEDLKMGCYSCEDPECDTCAEAI